MLNLIITACFTLLATAQRSQVRPYFGDEVVEVTVQNINNILRAHEYISIVFFAPWDRRSKSMFAPYSEAAKDLKKEGITVGAINGPRNRWLLK
jgi:hypothetical protein